MEKIAVKSVSKVAFNDERISIVGESFEMNIRLFNPEHHGKIVVGDFDVIQLANSYFLAGLTGTIDAAPDNEKVISLENEIVRLQQLFEANQIEFDSLISENKNLHDQVDGQRNERMRMVTSLSDEKKDLEQKLESAKKDLTDQDGLINRLTAQNETLESEKKALIEKVGELSVNPVKRNK